MKNMQSLLKLNQKIDKNNSILTINTANYKINSNFSKFLIVYVNRQIPFSLLYLNNIEVCGARPKTSLVSRGTRLATGVRC